MWQPFGQPRVNQCLAMPRSLVDGSQSDPKLFMIDVTVDIRSLPTTLTRIDKLEMTSYRCYMQARWRFSNGLVSGILLWRVAMFGYRG